MDEMSVARLGDAKRSHAGDVFTISFIPSPGAGASLAAGYVKIRWRLWSELVIGVVTAFQAGLLLLMNTTSNIWLCYAAYVLFRGSYQFLVPLAMCVVPLGTCSHPGSQAGTRGSLVTPSFPVSRSLPPSPKSSARWSLESTPSLPSC